MIGLDENLIKGQRGILAWVTFNGTGTVAIFQSYNVSSITDNGTGSYTVNFQSPMPHANFVVLGSAATDGVANNGFVLPGTRSTTSFGITILSGGSAVGNAYDSPYVSVVVIA